MADAPDLLDRLTWMAVNTMDNEVDALCNQAHEAIQARDAEIERLRAEVFAESYKAELRALEIVRLRNGVDALTNLFDDQCEMGRRYARAVNKAEAEVERLRAAGRALARHVDESGYGTDLERSLIAAWQEACRER